MAVPRFPNQMTANNMTGGGTSNFQHQPGNRLPSRVQQTQFKSMDSELQKTLSQINNFQQQTTHPSEGLHGQAALRASQQRNMKYATPVMYGSLASSFGVSSTVMMQQKAKELVQTKRTLSELKLQRMEMGKHQKIQQSIDKTQAEIQQYYTSGFGSFAHRNIIGGVTPIHAMGALGSASVSMSQAMSIKNLQTLQMQKRQLGNAGRLNRLGSTLGLARSAALTGPLAAATFATGSGAIASGVGKAMYGALGGYGTAALGLAPAAMSIAGAIGVARKRAAMSRVPGQSQSDLGSAISKASGQMSPGEQIIAAATKRIAQYTSVLPELAGMFKRSGVGGSHDDRYGSKFNTLRKLEEGRLGTRLGQSFGGFGKSMMGGVQKLALANPLTQIANLLINRETPGMTLKKINDLYGPSLSRGDKRYMRGQALQHGVRTSTMAKLTQTSSDVAGMGETHEAKQTSLLQGIYTQTQRSAIELMKIRSVVNRGADGEFEERPGRRSIGGRLLRGIGRGMDHIPGLATVSMGVRGIGSLLGGASDLLRRNSWRGPSNYRALQDAAMLKVGGIVPQRFAAGGRVNRSYLQKLPGFGSPPSSTVDKEISEVKLDSITEKRTKQLEYVKKIYDHLIENKNESVANDFIQKKAEKKQPDDGEKGFLSTIWDWIKNNPLSAAAIAGIGGKILADMSAGFQEWMGETWGKLKKWLVSEGDKRGINWDSIQKKALEIAFPSDSTGKPDIGASVGNWAMFGAGLGVPFGPAGIFAGAAIGGGVGAIIGFVRSEYQVATGKMSPTDLWNKMVGDSKDEKWDWKTMGTWGLGGFALGSIGGPVGAITGAFLGIGLGAYLQWLNHISQQASTDPVGAFQSAMGNNIVSGFIKDMFPGESFRSKLARDAAQSNVLPIPIIGPMVSSLFGFLVGSVADFVKSIVGGGQLSDVAVSMIAKKGADEVQRMKDKRKPSPSFGAPDFIDYSGSQESKKHGGMIQSAKHGAVIGNAVEQAGWNGGLTPGGRDQAFFNRTSDGSPVALHGGELIIPRDITYNIAKKTGTKGQDVYKVAANALSNMFGGENSSFPGMQMAPYKSGGRIRSFAEGGWTGAPGTGSLDDLITAGREMNGGTLGALVEKVAGKYGLDPALVAAIIQNESGWNPNSVSKTNDYGLMQINKSNFQAYGLTAQTALDPETNLIAGCQMLSSLVKKYHVSLEALAAYNAGEGGMKQGRGMDYAKKVMATYNSFKSNPDKWKSAASKGAMASGAGSAGSSGASGAGATGSEGMNMFQAAFYNIGKMIGHTTNALGITPGASGGYDNSIFGAGTSAGQAAGQAVDWTKEKGSQAVNWGKEQYNSLTGGSSDRPKTHPELIKAMKYAQEKTGIQFKIPERGLTTAEQNQKYSNNPKMSVSADNSFHTSDSQGYSRAVDLTMLSKDQQITVGRAMKEYSKDISHGADWKSKYEPWHVQYGSGSKSQYKHGGMIQSRKSGGPIFDRSHHLRRFKTGGSIAQPSFDTDYHNVRSYQNGGLIDDDSPVQAQPVVNNYYGGDTSVTSNAGITKPGATRNNSPLSTDNSKFLALISNFALGDSNSAIV